MASYDLSDKDGVLLVSTARKIATEFIKNGRKLVLDEQLRSRFSFEAGIFVTINSKEDLRGCIGFPLPKKMHDALPEAAIAAATQDPRFPPVNASELDVITFEVTVLTPPVEIKIDDPLQIPSKIKVGRDGLIIKHGYNSGLLLPQVPLEYGWSEEKFLDHTCQKAGLPAGCWKDKETRVFSFEGIVFGEEQPNGKITRKKL
jgi:uncharacterized protein (TIGR00296 family)